MHDFGETLIGVTSVVCLFGWIPILTYFKSKIRLEELRQQNRGGANVDNDAVNTLRQEIRALRDTTTKFDVAFDGALDRVEKRLDRLETQSSVGGIDLRGNADDHASVLARRS